MSKQDNLTARYYELQDMRLQNLLIDPSIYLSPVRLSTSIITNKCNNVKTI